MKINKNVIVLSTILTMALTTTVMAGQVGTITTFSSGTPAVASEVNGNFTENSTQINDNDTRITANETTIAANAAKITTIESGSVAVHGNNFHVPDNQTGCTDSNSLYLYMSAGANCNAYTSVSLPDGAKVTNLSCSVLDTATGLGEYVRVTLYRTNATTGASEALFGTPTSSATANVQVINDTEVSVAGTDVVDNASYFYKLDATFGTVNVTDTVRLYGCSIGYIATN